MSSKCRFKDCQWTGHPNDLFLHCDDEHRQCIIELRGQERDFWLCNTRELLNDNPFLLCGPEGIYWLAPNPRKTDNAVNWGVFHVGSSEPIMYKLKFGEFCEGYCEYIGIISRAETDEVYDLLFAFDYLNYLKANVGAEQSLVYLGDYNDSEGVYEPTSEDLIFNEEDETINEICVTNFTCPICLDFIKSHIRFCENKHFVCLHCFRRLGFHNILRCPVCRVDYPNNCTSQRLERFLRMVKFPASNDTDDLVEVPQRQKKPEEVEKVDEEQQEQQQAVET